MNAIQNFPELLAVLRKVEDGDYIVPPRNSEEETIVKLLVKMKMLFPVHYAQYSAYWLTGKGKEFLEGKNGDAKVK